MAPALSSVDEASSVPSIENRTVPVGVPAPGAAADTVALQVTDATERLETRKVLDRAKGVLMDRDGLSEQAAFDFLQKTAMTSRRAMRVVADEVLAGTLSPSEPGTGD